MADPVQESINTYESDPIGPPAEYNPGEQYNLRTGFAAMDPKKAHEIQMKGAKASADARRGRTADEFVHKGKGSE